MKSITKDKLKQKLYSPDTTVLEVKILFKNNKDAWRLAGELKDKYDIEMGYSIYALALAKKNKAETRDPFKTINDHLLEAVKMKEEKIEN